MSAAGQCTQSRFVSLPPKFLAGFVLMKDVDELYPTPPDPILADLK